MVGRNKGATGAVFVVNTAQEEGELHYDLPWQTPELMHRRPIQPTDFTAHPVVPDRRPVDLRHADTDDGGTSDGVAFSSHEAKTCKSTGNSPDQTPWGQPAERISVSVVYDNADSQA